MSLVPYNPLLNNPVTGPLIEAGEKAAWDLAKWAARRAWDAATHKQVLRDQKDWDRTYKRKTRRPRPTPAPTYPPLPEPDPVTDAPVSNRKMGGASKTSDATGGRSRRGKSKRMKSSKPRRKSVKANVNALRKKVGKLSKRVGKSMSTQLFLQNSTDRVTSSANSAGYYQVDCHTPSIIESLLNSLNYVNTAAPGTKAVYDATALTMPTKFPIQCRCTIQLRNNTLYPQDIKLYLITPKVHTNNSFATCAASDDDKMIISGGSADYTQPAFYPSDFPEFTQKWNCKEVCSMRLNPGDEMKHFAQSKFTYDHEKNDGAGTTYVKQYTKQWLIRIIGVIAHDQTTPTNIGYLAASADVIANRRISVKLPSLAPMKTVEQSNLLGSVTTPVVAGKDVELN